MPDPSRSTPASEAAEIDLVYRAARRFFAFKIGHRPAVEDLTQQVVVVYLSRRRDGLAVLDPAKFARGIARNLLLAHLRERTRGPVPFDSARMSPSRVYDSPTSRIDRHNRVLAILHALPNDQQDLLISRHVHGLTLPECATELGVSLATVKRYLVRAERAVRGDGGEAGKVVRRVWDSV